MLVIREFREMVRSRVFIVTTVIAVIAVAGLTLLPALVGLIQRAGTVRVAVADPTGVVEPLLARAVAQAGTAAGVSVEVWTPTGGTGLAAAAQAVLGGRVPAVLWVVPGPHGAADATYTLLTKAPSPQAAYALQGMLEQGLAPARLSDAGIDPASAQGALAGPQLRPDILAPGSASAHHPTAAMALAYFLLIFLYMAILMYGNMILVGVSAEKTSRVSELMLVSTRAERLLAGKVLGIGAAGLGQFSLLALTAGVVYLLDPAVRHLAHGRGMAFGAVPVWALPLLVLFFLLGFFLYSGVYAALGASAGRPEEAGSAGTLPTLVIVGAFMFALFGLGAPSSRLVVLASFAPPLTPWLMFERLVLGSVPWWQLVLAVAVTTAAITAILRWAAVIYRKNLLRDGAFSFAALFSRGR